jgi:subfamily B ATP-binding cassette protein MsbA
MYSPIKNVTRLYNQLHQAEAASARVFELLAVKNDIVDPANPVPLKASGAEVHFDNIDFSYGDKAVLRSINLTVKPGQLVALVGGSGSGKTTLVNLLPRFYDPQNGAVRIGGTNIKDVSVAELRRQIAIVTQETILFHDTVRSNIAAGSDGVTDGGIEAAARAANAHNFIADKPEGYNTIVGEKGAMLSGGQRQRISIARAILKDAPILILDEATNALDAEAERAVQEQLEKLMVGRTTICIAHRLSSKPAHTRNLSSAAAFIKDCMKFSFRANSLGAPASPGGGALGCNEFELLLVGKVWEYYVILCVRF